METYTTIISPEEQSLLLILLNDFMLGAKKTYVNKDSTMCIKNKNCSLWLTPNELEILGSLLSKNDILSEHHQKLLDWIMED